MHQLNRLPDRRTSLYKIVIRFNANADRDGTTDYSYDTPGDPQRGLEKLKRYALRVQANGHLKVAILYDNQTGAEVWRLYGK
jgi:hypothetical protein